MDTKADRFVAHVRLLSKLMENRKKEKIKNPLELLSLAIISRPRGQQS